mmetsp:Transcript_10296/g.25883  ORF Transcript_10296/g.25883 Transcript_10296/m.25883 type:complete len:243 (+) Transcript_10296:399-1127(+)
MSAAFPAAMAHGAIEEAFENVFVVEGTYVGEFFGATWTFGRNMVVVREGDQLTLINSVRLSDEGLAKLEALGKVKNLVKIGSLHGCDDAFYIERYHPTFWALPGMPHAEGVSADRELRADALPLAACKLFTFTTTKLPECVLVLERADGNIVIACDSLQNWEEADAHTDAATAALMKEKGFFCQANCGPAWMMFTEPKPEDFTAFKASVGSFEHAVCGHGSVLRGGASAKYAQTFKKLFGVE